MIRGLFNLSLVLLLPGMVQSNEAIPAVSKIVETPQFGTTVNTINEGDLKLYSIEVGKNELRKGENLFHSFNSFDIADKDIVRFANDSPSSPHTNIIVKINDSSQSLLNGTVSTTLFNSSDLFMFNPNGFVFGKNAKLDLSGSFFVSSSNSLQLKNSKTYDIDDNSVSHLSASSPTAFGFLTDKPGKIEFVGSNISSSEIGAQLSVVSPEIELNGSHISVENGDIQLISINEQKVDAGMLVKEQLEILRLGSIKLGNIKLLDFDGMPSSLTSNKLFVYAKDFEFSGLSGGEKDKFVFFDNEDLGGIRVNDLADIFGSESISVTNGANIVGEKMNSGILLRGAGKIHLSNLASVFHRFENSNITIHSDDFKLTSGSRIATSGSSELTGSTDLEDGSVITIKAAKIEISGSSLIPTKSEPRITKVDSSISGSDDGVAGKIEITGLRINLLESGSVQATSSSINKNSKGGNIVVNSEKLTIDNGSYITSSTTSEGSGGNIVINGSSIELSKNGNILSESTGSGASGKIEIDANSISLDVGSRISVETTGANAGPEDDLAIKLSPGGLLLIDNNSKITSSAIDPDNEDTLGNGGKILIANDSRSNLVLLRRGSEITAETSSGSGGDIIFNVQSVLRDPRPITKISANANSVEGEAGNIVFDTPDVDATTGTLELPETYFDASSLIANRCAAHDPASSSFITSQRDGLSASPDLLLAGYEDFDEFNSTNPSIESLVVADDTRNALGRINCSR